MEIVWKSGSGSPAVSVFACWRFVVSRIFWVDRVTFPPLIVEA